MRSAGESGHSKTTLSKTRTALNAMTMPPSKEARSRLPTNATAPPMSEINGSRDGERGGGGGGSGERVQQLYENQFLQQTTSPIRCFWTEMHWLLFSDDGWNCPNTYALRDLGNNRPTSRMHPSLNKRLPLTHPLHSPVNEPVRAKSPSLVVTAPY